MNQSKKLSGYLVVEYYGNQPERFLNLCSNHGIDIWNLEFIEERYRFCVKVNRFRDLKPILRKTKSRLKILQRSGFPFVIKKCIKRKLFFAGICLCGVLLYTMSLFIWDIQITGNLHNTDSRLIKYLNTQSVGCGAIKYKINCSQLEEGIRQNFDDIIWASVKIQGTNLMVDIQENLVTNSNPPSMIENKSHHLVATKDAEISTILTRTGTPKVEKGSFVQKGEILVEGRIPIINDNGDILRYEYCSADADVWGNTIYFYQNTFPMNYSEKRYTGRTNTSYEFLIGKKRFSFTWKKNHFDAYDCVENDTYWKLNNNLRLPLGIGKTKIREFIITKNKYVEEEAIFRAKEELLLFCEKLKEKGVQIIENNVIIVTDDKNCNSSGGILVVESIGIKQEIIDSEEEAY